MLIFVNTDKIATRDEYFVNISVWESLKLSHTQVSRIPFVLSGGSFEDNLVYAYECLGKMTALLFKNLKSYNYITYSVKENNGKISFLHTSLLQPWAKIFIFLQISSFQSKVSPYQALNHPVSFRTASSVTLLITSSALLAALSLFFLCFYVLCFFALKTQRSRLFKPFRTGEFWAIRLLLCLGRVAA